MLITKLLKELNYKTPDGFRYSKKDSNKERYQNFIFLHKTFKLSKRIVVSFEKQLIDKIYNNGLDIYQPSSESSVRRNTKSSISIEMSEDDFKNLSANRKKGILESYENAKDFLFSQNKITPEALTKIYYLISDNEKLINEKTNSKMNGEQFRKEPIFIGSKELLIKPKDIPEGIKIVCEYINAIFDINENKDDKSSDEKEINRFGLVAASVTHFFFEHVHPFPDFNGRIGRLLVEWILVKTDFPFPNINTSILSTRDSYYKSLELTEDSNDLTYIFIYFNQIGLVQPSILEIENISLKKKLSDKQESILINLFLNGFKLSAQRYKKAFNDPREYVSIQKDFQKLDQLGLLDHEVGKANHKIYFISEKLNKILAL